MTTNTSQRASVGPRIRPDLDVNEVPDGLVVYDEKSDRVHCLNHTAALIFCLCTGDNAESEIAEAVAKGFSLDVVPFADTAACLADFRREGLLA